MFVAPVDLLPPPRPWSLRGVHYAEMFSRTRYAFWTSHVDANPSQPRRLWRSFNELLGRGRSPPSAVTATDLHHYFDDEVADVRAATADVDPPTFTSAPVGYEPHT